MAAARKKTARRSSKRKAAEKRYFVLRDAKGREDAVFSGRQPRQAALKAANRGHKDIRLRERGTKKVHMFKGSRKQVPAPEGAPEWMGKKVWKPVVAKKGIQHLERL